MDMDRHPPGYQPGLSKNQGLVKQLREFQRNPRSLVFVSLSEAYRQEGLPHQALEILDEGLSHHPGLASAVVCRARCLFDLKRYAEALAETQLALRNNSQNLRAHKLQAEIYVRLGQRKAAIRALNHVVQLYPQDREAVRALEELENLERKHEVPETKPVRPGFDEAPALGRIEDFQVGPIAESMANVVSSAPAARGPSAAKSVRDGAAEWARETLPEDPSDGIVLPAQPSQRKRSESLEKKARALERMLAAVRLMKPMGT